MVAEAEVELYGMEVWKERDAAREFGEDRIN